MLAIRAVSLALLCLGWTVSWHNPLLLAQDGPEQLLQDSFEAGDQAPEGWYRGAAIPGVKYVYDRRIASDGERSLSLQKSTDRYFPIAQWAREIPHSGGAKTLQLAVNVKASRTTKAIVEVQCYDGHEKFLTKEWIAYIGQKSDKDPVANHDWKEYSGAIDIPRQTEQLVMALQIYGPGKVWFDELRAYYADSPSHGNQAPAIKAELPEQKTVAATPTPLQLPSGSWTRYLLCPPQAEAQRSAQGYPLLVVLPGGTGSSDFHPFVRRIHEQALDGNFVVVQPIAPPHIVWPTASSAAKFATTEAAISGIVAEVSKKHTIDPERIFALGWSSSGPAVYASLLDATSSLRGAMIAMSVFKPGDLPQLSGAADQRVYLYHSPEDRVCPFRMAQQAEQQLRASGAEVKLVEYAGGHGWHGDVFADIRAAIDWLASAD